MSFDLADLERQQHAQAADRLRAAGLESLDVIIVDDQADFYAGWYTSRLAGHNLCFFDGVASLWGHLAGPGNEPGRCPALALVDLDLGHGTDSGFSAVRLLRQRWPDLPIVLSTSPISDHRRELLAVFCAEVNGAPLVLLEHNADTAAQLAPIVERIAAARRASKLLPLAPDPALGWNPHLRWIHPVRVEAVKPRSRHPLSELVLTPDWKVPLWSFLRITATYGEAVRKAKDSVRAPYTATPEGLGREAARRQPWTDAVIWRMVEGPFHAVPGGLVKIEAVDSAPEFLAARDDFRSKIKSFAEFFERVLSSDEIVNWYWPGQRRNTPWRTHLSAALRHG